MSAQVFSNRDTLLSVLRHAGHGTRLLAASSRALRETVEGYDPPAPCTFRLSAEMFPGLTERQRRDAVLVQLDTESRNYTLTEIELPGFALDPQDAAIEARGGPRLAWVLERCPRLEYLNLRDCRSVLVWQEIALALPACTSLERVDLSNTRHGGPHSVFEGLRQCPSLTDLDLHDCDLRVMANSVARVMQACPALRRLNLSGNRLVTRDGMYLHRVAEALPHCMRLEHLDLSNNGLDEDAVRYLTLPPLGPLSRCPSLRHLNLADNKLTRVDVQRLSQSLEHVHTLRELNLRNNSLDLDGLRALVRFRICPRLTYLNLSRCFYGREACEFVAELAACPRLQHLDLSHNRLSDRFTQLLMRALPQCAALTRLDLAGNYISHSCVADIETAIERCPLLERLNLSENELRPADRDRLRVAWTRRHGESAGLWCA
jgi:Ran GTPase-activating protein (RanGAP) involved in mRNA processing and transport